MYVNEVIKNITIRPNYRVVASIPSKTDFPVKVQLQYLKAPVSQ